MFTFIVDTYGNIDVLGFIYCFGRKIPLPARNLYGLARTVEALAPVPTSTLKLQQFPCSLSRDWALWLFKHGA